LLSPSAVQPQTSPTRRRVPLRVLLRAPGVAPHALARRFEGYKVVILGFARTEDWAGLWRDGDLEGFVWVSPSLQVNGAIEDLRSFAEVVDARIAPRDVS
jgi:hypothetical protein